MKRITASYIEKIKLENKAMNLRRDEIAKEDKELLKKINENTEIIEKWKKIKKQETEK